MSGDKRRVDFDTRSAINAMTTAVSKSVEYLNHLARLHHKGRGDTWAAARDRAARSAGIERTYAKRIWDRWQTMTDVSGEAFMRLQKAYEDACAKHDAKADQYYAERLALREHNEKASQEPDAREIPAHDADVRAET